MVKEEDSSKDGRIPREKSQVRKDVEEALAKSGLALEMRISVTNLDSHEQYYFEDYSKALEFIRGKKGRWYLATPGIKRVGMGEAKR